MEVIVDAFLASWNEHVGYAQRSEPVSTRNHRLLILSVMKRWPVVVVHTCTAVVVFLVGGKSRAVYTFVPRLCSDSCTSRG
jgi:hypothetical protein